MPDRQKVFGIDYGSKMAGTTVVAYLEDNAVKWLTSEKKKDADQMILKAIESHKPDLVAIDAPLSLPGVYTGMAGCEDYFYRQADKATKAMSPMFLGGLTARAMKLSAQVSTPFIEVYPVKTGKVLGLETHGFRTKEADVSAILQALSVLTGWAIDGEDAVSGHHVDALLALYVGKLFAEGKANQLGKPEEGLIYY